MKRKIFFVLFILFIQYVFSQSYYINKDTLNCNSRGFDEDIELQKGTQISLDNNSEVSSYRPDTNTNIVQISGKYKGNKIKVYSRDLNILNSDTFEDEKINTIWIPSYYYDILKSIQIQESLFQYEEYWKNWKKVEEWETSWVDSFNVTNVILSNTNIFIPQIGHYNQSFVLFSELKKTDFGYIAKIKKVDSYTNHPKFITLLKSSEESLLSFIFDGDYMTIKLDDKEIIKLVGCNKSMYSYIKQCIRNNNCDYSKVICPHHADGSCDYELTQKASFTLDSIMTVKENLKLCSGEATSTDILTVMSEGSKVQILEIGKSDIIGGVKSNWVKVKIQKGSRTPEGYLIRPGLIGWCFGGYLE